jgi:hypothetical protein
VKEVDSFIHTSLYFHGTRRLVNTGRIGVTSLSVFLGGGDGGCGLILGIAFSDKGV